MMLAAFVKQIEAHVYLAESKKRDEQSCGTKIPFARLRGRPARAVSHRTGDEDAQTDLCADGRDAGEDAPAERVTSRSFSRRRLLQSLSLVLLPTGAEAARPLWPAGKRGAVSLTYDDGLDSQLDLAVPALDRFGFKATFFLTYDNIKRRLSDWARLARMGHELANHTVTHPCDLGPFTPSSYRRRELVPMARWLGRTAQHPPVRSFAYPCDVTNLGAGDPNRQEARFDRLLASAGIAAARTSEGEPNRPATTLRRPHRLQALAVGFDATDFAAVDAYLRHAAAQGYWAILVFHDIAAVPTEAGQTGIALHSEILQSIADGPLWCAPLATVFDRIRQRA